VGAGSGVRGVRARLIYLDFFFHFHNTAAGPRGGRREARRETQSQTEVSGRAPHIFTLGKRKTVHITRERDHLRPLI
jgi:hypothetical protein